MYINLLAKKLGQPFSEIHADSISANKQEKGDDGMTGFSLFGFNSLAFIKARLFFRSIMVFL